MSEKQFLRHGLNGNQLKLIAVISMLCVIFILPALLLLCDPIVCATTFGMKKCRKQKETPQDSGT